MCELSPLGDIRRWPYKHDASSLHAGTEQPALCQISGVQAREQVIKRAIYEVTKDKDAVERLFAIIKQQAEY